MLQVNQEALELNKTAIGVCFCWSSRKLILLSIKPLAWNWVKVDKDNKIIGLTHLRQNVLNGIGWAAFTETNDSHRLKGSLRFSI